MTTPERLRSRRLAGWLLAVALAAALPYALKISADNDLWWHTRAGQLILELGELPATDPFSFTATGAEWTNHEWLSDVVLAGLHAFGGDRAMSLWRTGLLIGLSLLLATLLWRRFSHPLFVLAALLLAAPLLRVFITLRPHVYTYLFVLLVLLLYDRSRSRPALLWLLPPMMALWTNLHGGFVLGLGFVAVMTASHFAGFEEDGPAVDRRRRLLLAAVFAACVTAPLINPYGFGLFSYLYRELGADHSLIIEWRGIWSFPDYRPIFVLLLALPLSLLLVGRRLRPTGPLIMLGVCAAATWVHGRFVILLLLFSLLVSFSCLASVFRRYPRLDSGSLLSRLREPRWAWALCALPLLAAVLQFTVDLRQKGLRLQIDPTSVPVVACEFLRAHDLGPNLLLRFDWGGYALWHLYPRYRVSGDGRNITVYDAGFVDEMLRAYDTGRFADYSERYDVDVILSEAAGPTYRALRSDPGWLRVHEDRLAAVFVRPDVARTLERRRESSAQVDPASERFFFP